MSLLSILARVQGGGLYESAGRAAGLSASEVEAAMAVMCPAIAARLKARSEDDPGIFDNLLGHLEDGGIDAAGSDAEWLTGTDAIADGYAVLDDIYGSRDAAIKAMRVLAGQVPETSLGRLAAISAAAVLGALSQTYKPMQLARELPAAGGQTGVLGTILSALLKGLMQGLSQQFAPRRRSRSRYTSARSRGKSATKRRSASHAPTLEDVFGEILGTTRN